MLYFCAVICLFRLNIVSSFGMNKGADVSHTPLFRNSEPANIHYLKV